MPDLEELKKQAKLILRWHREARYPVAAEIRGLIPRSRMRPMRSFWRRVLSSRCAGNGCETGDWQFD
jgi:hypothetical protein